MTIDIWTDGASKGNPGAASVGYVIRYPDGSVTKVGQPIGTATNNVAEYKAVIAAMAQVTKSAMPVRVFSDSQLVVNQLNGTWEVRDVNMQTLHGHVKSLEPEFGATYIWIPRESNKEADAMANEALGKL